MPNSPAASLIQGPNRPEFRCGNIAGMLIPDAKVLAGVPAVRHTSVRPLIPGGRCSQGGVKVPTGGKGDVAQARERLLLRELLSEVLQKKGQQIRCDSEADG